MMNINPKQLQKAMQQMGVKQQNLDAFEVIIKLKDKSLVFKNPQVAKITMMGNESFQITGDSIEVSLIDEDDINTVAEQANVSKEEAKEALEKTKGDLAEAILLLKKE